MSLQYKKADELPAWQATVSINGALPDFSSGWTFSVRLGTTATATPTLTKTTGISGAASGVITVAWAANELNIAVGDYVAHLTATRTSDSAEATITEKITISPRL